MKKLKGPLHILKDQKGILTVDYLLASVLVMGFTVILFSISVTLTVVEISQYVTFSASRAFYASHFTTKDQRDLGQAKMAELLNNPVLSTFYKNGWFEITNPLVDENAGVQLGYDSGESQVDLFQGARLTLKANMLDFEIPGYGSTSSSDFGTEQGFTTQIGSYLSKEPSFGDCTGFNKDRWKFIKKLTVPGGVAGYDTAPSSDNAALAIHDNGC